MIAHNSLVRFCTLTPLAGLVNLKVNFPSLKWCDRVIHTSVYCGSTIPPNYGGSQDQKTKFGVGKWLLLVFPVGGIVLGTWQYQRKQWKANLIKDLQEKTLEDPIPFPDDLTELQSLEYQPLAVRGTFDHSKELHVEPRSLVAQQIKKDISQDSLISVRNDNVGLQVITPFKLAERDLTILINRGFVPRDKKDPRSRSQGQVTGVVSLAGVLRHNEKRPQLSPSNRPFENHWFYKDLDEMAAVTGASPILLDANFESTVPMGPIGGQTRTHLRDEHLSYMVTWYGLAIATSSMWYFRFIKK